MAKRTQADIALAWLLEDLSVADAARLLDVSSSTVRRWRKAGVPEGRRAGITIKYGRRTAEEAIRNAMAEARDCVRAGLGGHPLDRVVVNRDQSIDAQLTIYDIPRGMGPPEAITLLAECCRALRNTFSTFIQVGMRWGTRGAGPPPTSGDRRYRGLAEGSTFYYAIAAMGRCFLHALEIAKNVARKSRRRKIETIFVRLHWNPAGAAPKNWQPAKAVYRAYKRKGES